jgi:murein DD-endopeptidase MepM/ murein hydrolase activator NlpD/tetratricopeptide (TPR) repeat protein
MTSQDTGGDGSTTERTRGPAETVDAATDGIGPEERSGAERTDATDGPHSARLEAGWLPWATDRRTLLRGPATGALGGLAGCALRAGDRTFRAEPVHLADAADKRGYGLVQTDRPTLTRSFDAGGAEREATLESFYASYEHGTGVSVALVSSPDVSPAGQPLNPLATKPLGELLTSEAGEQFRAQLGIESEFARGPEAVGTGDGRLFESSTDVSTFAGVTEAGTFALVNTTRADEGSDAVLVGHAWTTDVEDPERPLVGPDGYVEETMVEDTIGDFVELLPLVRYGQAPEEGTEPSRDRAPEPLVANAEDDEAWHVLGGRMSKARIDGDPTRVNDDLRPAADAASTPGLDLVFEFWVAENHKHAGDYETARGAFDELLARYDEFEFLDIDFRETILRRRATMEEELERVDDALATYDTLVEATDGEAARPYFRKGLAAERAGRTGAALAAYENAASAEDPDRHHLAGLDELARRNAERVRYPFDGFRDTEADLRHTIAEALRNDAYDRLRDLASPTHFSVGPAGGCMGYVNVEALIERLIEDAEASAVKVDVEDTTETDRNVYLHTDNWSGDLFEDEVYFELSESPLGWSWEGLAVWSEAVIDFLDRNPELWGYTPDKTIPDASPTPTDTPTPTPTPTPTATPEPQTNKYPAIDIAAPFRKGQKFRAGGFPHGSGGGCGLGVAGFFYDEGPTHRASNANSKHAVDFTQYLGFAGTISAQGKHVLATNDGVVRNVVEKYDTGAGTANKVRLKHYGKHRCGVYADYSSRYLHLDGMYKVPVSKGQPVKQGSRLGNMDNTGVSAVHHLHFKVRNLKTGDSVRLSPMDGQNLNPSNDGDCIQSKNVETVVLSSYSHSEPSC